MNHTTKEISQYQNNPFLIAIDGVKLLFKRAQNTAIFLAILSLILFFFSATPNSDADEFSDSQSDMTMAGDFSVTAENWPIIAIIVGAILILVIGIMLISVYIQAIADYTSAQLAKDKDVTLSEAASQAGHKFMGYLWVQIIVAVKTFLWSLLLIIPGIYKANRYSLAGVVYFAENLKGNKAVQRSQQLVNGAWITAFAGMNFLNLVTLGIATLVLGAGSHTTLYRQFNALGDQPKPAASMVSWLIFIVPAILLTLVVLLGVIVFSASTYNFFMTS